jgi:hydroxyquinol 1,2-dioxygenase
MIAGNEDDITAAVLSEAERTPDPRSRELLMAAVRHLHAFVREVRLTEPEFFQLLAALTRAGQASNAAHNEVVLGAGSLGLSALVCMVNNGANGTANLLGPFWRADAPLMARGESIVRGPVTGEPVLARVEVVDAENGRPVPAAEVDVWHASPEGFYENQDPGQADMNLRGRFVCDADGTFDFTTVKPAGYPVPVNGPVGDLLRLQGRHNLRPAHIHFLIASPGYKTQFAQVYSADDPHLETDVQFAVTRRLVAHYRPRSDGGWLLEQRFELMRGTSRMPVPPITGKSDGERPVPTVLTRRGRPEQS